MSSWLYFIFSQNSDGILTEIYKQVNTLCTCASHGTSCNACIIIITCIRTVQRVSIRMPYMSIHYALAAAEHMSIVGGNHAKMGHIYMYIYIRTRNYMCLLTTNKYQNAWILARHTCTAAARPNNRAFVAYYVCSDTYPTPNPIYVL